jgi:hypothetical protein
LTRLRLSQEKAVTKSPNEQSPSATTRTAATVAARHELPDPLACPVRDVDVVVAFDCARAVAISGLHRTFEADDRDTPSRKTSSPPSPRLEEIQRMIRAHK